MTETTTSRRAIPAAPGFLTAGFRIFDLSLGEMLWSRRTIFMLLVVGAPILIAVFLRVLVALGAPILESTRMTGPAIFGLMIWVFYLRFTVPVLGVFYGTSLMADEVEDKTITYLFTRPIRRGAVLFGKYLAYLGCTVLVVLPGLAVWAAWRPGVDPARRLGRARRVLARELRVDDGYDRAVVRPVGGAARLAVGGDADVVEAYVRGTGWGADRSSWLLGLAQTRNVATYVSLSVVAVVLAGVLLGVLG